MRELGHVGEADSRIDLVDLGVMPYREAWLIQQALVEKRVAGLVPDTLLFVEHPPVITLGRGAQRGEEAWVQANQGTEVIKIERGGLATYHGPGQMVVYPIFRLDRRHASASRAGVVNLIRSLENWIVATLSSLEIKASALEGKTGVWVQGLPSGAISQALPLERKIASIGIAVRRWVSFHGLALNYATGIEPWRQLNPCGFSANVMTDLSLETGKVWSREEVLHILCCSLRSHLV
jgi:lipoyl(octanoyl) transferase